MYQFSVKGEVYSRLPVFTLQQLEESALLAMKYSHDVIQFVGPAIAGSSRWI